MVLVVLLELNKNHLFQVVNVLKSRVRDTKFQTSHLDLAYLEYPILK